MNLLWLCCLAGAEAWLEKEALPGQTMDAASAEDRKDTRVFAIVSIGMAAALALTLAVVWYLRFAGLTSQRVLDV